jgi:hypothetical protein
MHGPTNSEPTAADEPLEPTVADVPAHVEEHGGLPVIVTDRPMELMSAEETRTAVERVRR